VLVKNWMSKPVVTVDVKDSMQDAMDLLKEKHIRRLAVTDKGRLAGIITDRDLKRASASDATSLDIHELLYLLSKIKVESIMTRNPITVPEDFTIEETAEVLLAHKISGVLVMDGRKALVGIITQSDIFRALISLTGIGKKGAQFALMLEDRPGSIMEVTNVIRKTGGRMVSILSTYDRVPEGQRKVYIRMVGINRAKLDEVTKELSGMATLLYMVDHRENRRVIYQ
jgi:acetoin utilization protein AcuB